MAGITSSGLGSGIDVEGIVAKLMTVERAPLDAIKKRQDAINAKLSAYGSIKGAVSAFRDAMNGLNSLERYKQKKIAIADEAIAKVSTSSIAVPGSYSLEVTQLAQSQKLVTKTVTNLKDEVGTGTITVDFGSYADGTFTANADKPSKTITIDAAHSSLSGIRDAINEAKIGVSASVLNDGTGFRLVLKSDDTGQANGLKVQVSGDSDGNDTDTDGLSLFNYDPAVTYPPDDTTHMRASVVAQDALLTVDGVSVKKSKNLVDDVIQGATINLTKATAANTPTQIDIAQDKDKIKESINNFAKTYNDLRNVVKDLTAYNASTKTGSVLQGDYMAQSIGNKIARILGKSMEGLAGQYGFLAQIGVALQRDGSLAVDDSKVTEALDKHPDDVAALFSEIGRSTDNMATYAAAGTQTLAGSYDVTVSQLATRAELSIGGFTGVPFTVNNGDGLQIKVDGTDSDPINLTPKTYATDEELVSDLQTQINQDAKLRKAGKSVVISVQGNALQFNSKAYGSSSSLTVTGLKLGAINFTGSGTAGQDAQGTLGGVAAVGKGQYLTGASGTNMDGLQVLISGGALGDRGSVYFSHGYAYEFSNFAKELLDNGGALSNRTDSLQSQLKTLDKRQADFEYRMTRVEERLKAQFSAMDKLVGNLRSTSDYLTQQLK